MIDLGEKFHNLGWSSHNPNGNFHPFLTSVKLINLKNGVYDDDTFLLALSSPFLLLFVTVTFLTAILATN